MGVDYLDTVAEAFCGKATVDADLVHVGGLSGLETLALNRTAVTDAGLEHLEGTPPPSAPLD